MSEPAATSDDAAREPPRLRAEGLRVGHQGRPLLPALDLEVRAGELWAVLGRNGAGKTTLLRTLLGLLPPVGGRLTVFGNARIGYVPQRSDLDLGVPARVLDIVRTGIDRGWSFLSPWPSKEEREKVERVLEEMEVAPLARRPFAELSEGQKQRALLARALISDPDVLVLDEPTSAMDRRMEHAVFELLERLAAERGLALLVVTHDLEHAVAAATHGVFVDKDDGIALAGPIRDVVQSAAFIHYFGAVCAVLPSDPNATEEVSA